MDKVLASIVPFLLLSSRVSAQSLPSCDDDVGANCLGEEADMSPEGINACLHALGESRSATCSAYLALLDGCAADIGPGGACENDHLNGDGVVCLIQRTDPEKLSSGCVEVLPAKKAESQLNKFWKNGKVELVPGQVQLLNEEEKEVYQRWRARKAKSGKRQQDRSFAIKKKSKAKAAQLIVFKASGAATKAIEAGLSEKEVFKATRKVAKAECKKRYKEDKLADLGLGKFTKHEITDLAEEAIKHAEKELKNSKKRKANNEL